MTTEVRGLRDDPLAAACLVQGICLEEPIGRGRFGTVWRARWRGRDVAVKVVAAGRGGAAPRGLRHPAILELLATGEALGQRLFVFERYPTDLRRLLGGRPLRMDLLRPVLLALLDALDHAHRRGVAHGDLKPANVLVDPAGPRIALADFGAADDPPDLEGSLPSLERGEAAAGAVTLPYLAPERRTGGPATPAADVFALGAVLFELLTGRAPGGLELPSELATEGHRVDRRWDGLVKQCLARDPGGRPPVDRLRREALRLLPRPADLGEAETPQDDMVLIEGGFVVVGDAEDPDARPLREVRFAAFWLDRTPVTHRAWQAFVQHGGGARPTTWPARGPVPARLLDLPVTGVVWAQVEAYARWCGKRLPTEVEWERAAQGPEHRRYPWGDAFDAARAPAALAPVFTTPDGRSSEGVFDLCGNGWEWTASWFVPPGHPGPGKARTIKGGRDPARPRSGSAHHRAGLKPDVADPLVGFRCARDA